jgi:hypothetical protein
VAGANGAEGTAERAREPEPELESLLARVDRLEREVAELRAGQDAGMRDPSQQER